MMWFQLPEWVNTLKKCPKCGGFMQKNTTVVYTSFPPKYQFRCAQCGETVYDFQYIREDTDERA